MEELRDKLLERAGQANTSPSNVKELVEAALHLDVHISQGERDKRHEVHYFGLSERVDELEAEVKKLKKGKGTKESG